MYVNDDILGYICVNLPSGPFTPGWIETAIVSKGLKGTLRSKNNQKIYVTPIQETAKAFLDRGLDQVGETGIAILGMPGLSAEKLVILVRKSKNDTMNAVAFRSKDYNPLEIIRIILKFEFNRSLSSEFEEPPLDYLESLKDDANERFVTELLALQIPSGKNLTRSWIHDAVKDESTDSGIILMKHGKLRISPAIGLLFSNWITSITDVKQHSKLIAACLVMRTKTTEGFFWDGPRKTVSMCIYKGNDLEDYSRKVLLPLWALPTERIRPPLRTREVLISGDDSKDESPIRQDTDESDKVSPDLAKSLESISSVIDAIDINNLQNRLERIEHIFDAIEIEKPKPSVSNRTQIESRLNETVDRLESLITRLSKLEKRINAIQKKRGA